jgi:hypothetical protein
MESTSLCFQLGLVRFGLVRREGEEEEEEEEEDEEEEEEGGTGAALRLRL